jgi:hypothetical protein
VDDRPLSACGRPRIAYDPGCAGVAQWQSRSFPSLRRGFDSLHPLHSQTGKHFLCFDSFCFALVWTVMFL